MARYAERLKKDIERWSAEGLIDAATAMRLTTDVDAKAVSRISFTTVFAMMAAILLGAALLLLVAANWEAMPRLLRVALLFTLILVGYVGGAVLKLRGQAAFGEGAFLLGAIAFGGSIALIAQMYHLSGDEADAILTWFFAAVLAAVLLRSPTLTIGAVILSAVWLAMSIDFGVFRPEIPYLWLALAAVAWLVSFWTAAPPARHLLSLVLVFFTWVVFFNRETLLMPVLVLVLAGALITARLYAPVAARLLGLAGGTALHGLVHFLSAMLMIHVLFANDSLFFLFVLVTLAGLAAILVLAGRHDRPLRWMAYAAFAIELCYVYVALLGTMIDTAIVLLFAGLSLGALAWGIRRFEARWVHPSGGEAAT